MPDYYLRLHSCFRLLESLWLVRIPGIHCLKEANLVNWAWLDLGLEGLTASSRTGLASGLRRTHCSDTGLEHAREETIETGKKKNNGFFGQRKMIFANLCGTQHLSKLAYDLGNLRHHKNLHHEWAPYTLILQRTNGYVQRYGSLTESKLLIWDFGQEEWLIKII